MRGKQVRRPSLRTSSQPQNPLSNRPRTPLLTRHLSPMGLTAVVSSPTPTLRLRRHSPPQRTAPPGTPASSLRPPAHRLPRTPPPPRRVLLPASPASPRPLRHHLYSAPSHRARPSQSPGRYPSPPPSARPLVSPPAGKHALSTHPLGARPCAQLRGFRSHGVGVLVGENDSKRVTKENIRVLTMGGLLASARAALLGWGGGSGQRRFPQEADMTAGRGETSTRRSGQEHSGRGNNQGGGPGAWWGPRGPPWLSPAEKTQRRRRGHPPPVSRAGSRALNLRTAWPWEGSGQVG